MKNAVVIHETDTPAIIAPMAIEDIVGQVALIQSVMSKIMTKDEHYGVIPGTGNKPSLLKPGAEKLSMTFKLVPQYEIQSKDMGSEHREYEVICNISTQTGIFLGSGVGNCNTKESKYRYRSENTGKPVPGKYWESRDADLLGGKQFKAKKKDGKWVICEQIEHDNPADYFNTVKKLAKKRAFVDAVLTVTAASDIFTQDIEDMPNFDKENPQKTKDTPPPPADQTNQVDQANRLVKLMNADETAKDLQRRYQDNAKLIASFSENLKKQIYECYWTCKKVIESKTTTPPPATSDSVSETSVPQNEEEILSPQEEDLPPIFDGEPPPEEQVEPSPGEQKIIDAKAFLDSATKDQLPGFMKSLKKSLDKMPLENQAVIRKYYESLLKK